jgi:hypothetical protein
MILTCCLVFIEQLMLYFYLFHIQYIYYFENDIWTKTKMYQVLTAIMNTFFFKQTNAILLIAGYSEFHYVN